MRQSKERRYFPVQYYRPKEEGDDKFKEENLLIADTKRWLAACMVLLKTLYLNSGNFMVSAAILKIHAITVLLCPVGSLRADKMVYDECYKEFEEILKFSEMVIRAEALRITRFSGFDMGVVVSLQFMAQKCRNTGLSRKAIALMLEHPRREGTWDSLFSGRLME